MMHAEGLAWASHPELTISFAPDGTDVAGQSSSLFAEMSTLEGQPWQQTILSAFEAWANFIVMDVLEVPDSGDRFGISGPVQGDPRFGDVRIAAVELSTDVIAISVPHDELMSGTWTGDVLINTNARFSNLDELYSVMLHEAGHVFGLEHSTDSDSPMFFHGVSEAVVPALEDIVELRRRYDLPIWGEGFSQEDWFHSVQGGEGESHHEEYAGPRPSEPQPSSPSMMGEGVQELEPSTSGRLWFSSEGVLNHRWDVDTYRLSAGSHVSSEYSYLTVTVRATDSRGVWPQVEVLSSGGRMLESQVVANADGTYIVQVADVSPEESYLIRVRAAHDSISFLPGRYDLEARFLNSPLELNELVAETLTTLDPRSEHVLNVPETALAHFVLSADLTSWFAPVVVWADIYDAQDHLVGRVATGAGNSQSTDALLLPAGQYRLTLTAASVGGWLLPDVDVQLLGKTISLPIGPGITDPIQTPMLPITTPGTGMPTPTLPGFVVTDPVVMPGPILMPTRPQPVIVSPPWTDPNWGYWRTDVLAGVYPRVVP